MFRFSILAVLGLALTFQSFAQDPKVKPREPDPKWDKINDENVSNKLANGERRSIEELLPGYFNRLEDRHSYAKRNEASTTHLDLDISVDFDKETISGKAKYRLVLKEGDEVVFDTRDLIINGVSVDGKPTTKFNLGEEDPILGRPLTVKVAKKSSTITIDYQTTEKSAALQWLSPTQADSKLPFLFTQGEAILTRSWIPIQDSPSIKMTYSAKVKVSEGMRPVMSAEDLTPKSTNGVFEFRMDHPIPAYLIALAVGDLSFQAISNNCGIYALPNVVESAAAEFSETPKMIAIAERIIGPYVWGRYDMIVLPRAFPFGGMENPRLTFLTPTVIAGDKSLVSLIAHELAHSWSGNLVTNGSWDDFWLNEGITVYLERRIIEDLRGKEFASMHRYNGIQDLNATINELGETSEDVHLKLNLQGRDPDDGMTDVAYEKGALFLEYIEGIVGRESLDKALKEYFTAFKYKTINTENFLVFLNKKLNNQVDQDLIYDVVYGAGRPKISDPKPARFIAIDTLVLGILKKGEFPTKKFADFSVPEWLYFLDILNEASVNQSVVSRLYSQADYLNSNSEIQTKWFVLCITSGFEKEDERIEKFVSQVGRRKFLVPIYKALHAHTKNMKRTKGMYLKVRNNYHSITQNTIDDLFGVTEKEVHLFNSLHK